MIEVEKKFILSDYNREQLTKDAEFLNERVFTDIYYDTKDFSLTSRDIWLRSREGRFELKIPLHINRDSDRLIDQYDELQDELEIRRILDLPLREKLSDDLMRAGYSPFCTCKTTRRKYKKESFIIDLDSADFQDFIYNIGEIELMVNDKSESEAAAEKIVSFAKKHHLTIAPVRGKIIEFLRKTSPTHYEALIKKGVVKDS